MFSVIIPLYNKADSIKATLSSVLAQSFPDFEIVVVDDGSTDGGADLVASFTDGRIRLIKTGNRGVSSARNIGINAAIYDFVAFLDADDIWDKDYLAEQVKMVQDFPQASMWGINFAEISDGRKIRSVATGLPDGYRGIVDDYFLMPERSGRVSDLFCSSSVVLRKAVFDECGMFDERLKYSEDIDMWFRVIALNTVAFYDRDMVFYQFDAANRAMKRHRELKYWLPFYPDKFFSFTGKEPFYTFIQRWCAVNVKECYFNDKSQRADAKVASSRLDYAVLPTKYRYFFNTPYCIGKAIYLAGELKNKLRCCR